MNTPARVLAGIAAVAAILGLGAGFAAPAQAAYQPPPYPTDGQTYVYGVPIGQLPTARPIARATVGGWFNQDWHKTSFGYFSNSTGNPFRPLWFELWEPYIDASHNLQIGIYYNAPQDNQNGGNLYASGFSVGNGTFSGGTPTVWCQQTEWAVAGAPSSTHYPLAGSFSAQAGGFNGAAQSATNSVMALNSANVNNCPYIRQIDVHLQWWTAGGTSGSSSSDMMETWYAQNAFVDHTVYQPYEGLRDICALTVSTVSNPVSPGCTDLLGQANKIDGENFQQVCANPPATWVWGDFSWLAGFVGFYAHCLFNPVNGWDRDHTLANAWSNGPIGQVVTPITNTINALNLPNACGYIIPGAGGLLGGLFNVNTCTWTWAGQLHDALAVILPLWFGWWALWFVVSSISGVINRKVPTPVQLGREL